MKRFGIEYLDKLLEEMDKETRRELEAFDQAPERDTPAVRQSMAYKQGKLSATKAIRIRIRNDTGLELNHTRAPPDARRGEK